MWVEPEKNREGLAENHRLSARCGGKAAQITRVDSLFVQSRRALPRLLFGRRFGVGFSRFNARHLFTEHHAHVVRLLVIY